MLRRLRELGIAAIVLAAIAVSAGGAAHSAVPDLSPKLSLRSLSLLSDAKARGESAVTLLVAAVPGANAAASAAIQQLGGVIQYREDDISYLRVTVGTDAVARLAALASVKKVDVDEIVPLPDPRQGIDGAVVPTPQPPPGASTPRDNPYMPIADTRAAQFVAMFPTYDGRGVRIGIVDTGVTLDHPSLLATSTGQRKIVDWVTATDPFTDDDPSWVDMSAQVSGPAFVWNGRTYTAPYAGSFRIGVFNERDPRLGGEIGNDVNRDGNPAGSSGAFAVLWDTAANRVWVDTNQNASFADELGMTDYKTGFDVGWFGTDNPATAVAERIPFVIQTDGRRKVVNIGIISDSHGSHVAGIAAAHSMFGGAMSGAAPGATLVSVRACLFVAGCTAHAMIEGMIYAAKQANVDVINMSIGGLPALNDGSNARAELYNRLIERYNVQMFISAGNDGPGMNTVGDPSVATRVVSVGSYITRDSWQRNYGSDSAFADNLHTFSSTGPREDGGFKPQIVAPGSAVSTTPMWQHGGPIPGTYSLPPGYQMFNGTSMAAPQATGAAALLISAAKQARAQRQPAQLRQAMLSSARLLDTARIPVFAQGNGLLDTVAAWNLLRTNIKTAEIVAEVEVSTLLDEFLQKPGIGIGIHDREGVTVGRSYLRNYTFTRTKGGSRPVRYNVVWLGNDGTFSSPGTVDLPLNVPVTFPVGVSPTTAGAHSAIMNLDDPATAGIDFQTMNVVVAAEEFVAAGNFQVSHAESIGRNQQQRYQVRVPANTAALKVDFAGPSSTPGTGQARFLRYHPFGVDIDSNVSTSCYSPSAGSCVGSPNSRTMSRPQAGVWEVTVDARRTSDTTSAPYTLTASILGSTVAPDPDVIAAATAGVPIARSYTVTNQFAAFTGRAVGTALGSAFRAVPTIADGGPSQFFDVQVPAGSSSLRATIGAPSDPAADLDLYVYDCTAAAGDCLLAGSNADGDSEESVTIPNPAAGHWKIEVVAYAVPAGSTTYRYLDIVGSSAFGSVSLTDANALRPSGASWVVPGSVTANAAPAAGRFLLGAVQVRTDTNVLVGSGEVVVGSVVP